jgi:tetratricopeptide (TPR) repeat protein
MKIKRILVLFGVAILGVFLMTSCQPPELTSAKVYFQQDNLEKAKEQLEIAKDKYPDNPEVYYLLATKVYGPKGELDKANEALDKAVELDPEYKSQATQYKRKIWANYQNRAVKKFNEALDAIFPEVKDSLLKVAAGDFQKALEISDTSKSTYTGIVQCYYQLNDTAMVQKYAQNAMNKGIFDENILSAYTATFANPDEALAELQKVTFLIKQKRYDEALQIGNNLLNEDPDNKNLRFLLAQVHMRKGNVEKATEEYQKVLQQNPDDPAVLVRVAQAYFESKEYDKAEEYSRRYIARLEENDQVKGLGIGYEILWKSLFNLGEKEEALEMRKKARQYR